ncbi:hypothetical protein sch_09970 [Serratia plymuthica]|nr:hypothetical protein sch_09970 [Serratia plymuthica]
MVTLSALTDDKHLRCLRYVIDNKYYSHKLHQRKVIMESMQFEQASVMLYKKPVMLINKVRDSLL